MLDLLASTAAVTIVLVLVGLAGLALTVLPFVSATRTAERSGRSAARAGSVTVLAVAAGLAGSSLVLRGDLPAAAALLPLLLCWVVPAAVALPGVGGTRLGGRRGLHE